jgi:hypothetical protein
MSGGERKAINKEMGIQEIFHAFLFSLLRAFAFFAQLSTFNFQL